MKKQRTKRKNITAEEIAKINDLFNQGFAKSKIALMMDRSVSTVTEHTPRNTPKLNSPENVKIMLDLHAKGMSQNFIAKAIGVSQSTIQKHISKMNIKKAPKKKKVKSSGFVTALNTPFY